MAVDQEEVTFTRPKFLLRRRDSMQALGAVCIRLVFEPRLVRRFRSVPLSIHERIQLSVLQKLDVL